MTWAEVLPIGLMIILLSVFVIQLRLDADNAIFTLNHLQQRISNLESSVVLMQQQIDFLSYLRSVPQADERIVFDQEGGYRIEPLQPSGGSNHGVRTVEG